MNMNRNHTRKPRRRGPVLRAWQQEVRDWMAENPGARQKDAAEHFECDPRTIAIAIQDATPEGRAARLKARKETASYDKFAAEVAERKANDLEYRASCYGCTGWSRGVERCGADNVATDPEEIEAIKKLYRVQFYVNNSSGLDRFDPNFMEIDHKTPVSAGGGHFLNNLELIPRHEHLAKSKQQQLCQTDDCLNQTDEDALFCTPCNLNNHVIEREFGTDADAA